MNAAPLLSYLYETNLTLVRAERFHDSVNTAPRQAENYFDAAAAGNLLKR
jgi:hypothetical protein